jgi:hypothetical protein
MIFTASQGQCENWKEFFKDGDGTWQYDKDSIHYPKTKKNFLGLTVRDKNIVNVWTQPINGKEGPCFFCKGVVTIKCAERTCSGADGCSWEVKFFPNNWFSIEPGSRGESLLKKVCP